jgi:hypothetical protein
MKAPSPTVRIVLARMRVPGTSNSSIEISDGRLFRGLQRSEYLGNL